MLASVDVVACEKGEASARGSGRTLLALVHELDAILQKLAGGLDKLLNLIGHAGGLYGPQISVFSIYFFQDEKVRQKPSRLASPLARSISGTLCIT